MKTEGVARGISNSMSKFCYNQPFYCVLIHKNVILAVYEIPYGDETVLWPYYLHNDISYTGKACILNEVPVSVYAYILGTNVAITVCTNPSAPCWSQRYTSIPHLMPTMISEYRSVCGWQHSKWPTIDKTRGTSNVNSRKILSKYAHCALQI